MLSKLKALITPFIRAIKANFRLSVDAFKRASILKKFTIASNAAYPIMAAFTGEPVFILLMLLLGVSSAFFHALDTPLGADLDVGMIHSILLFMTAGVFGVNLLLAFLPALVGGFVFRKANFFSGLKMEVKVGILIAPLVVFGLLSGMPLFVSTVVLGVALALRQFVDHGLWHAVSAAGLALMASVLLG